MAKGSNIMRVREYTEDRLIRAIDKKAAVGYYNRSRPPKKPALHLKEVAPGVYRRVSA
jgi:hypothetical protein